MAKKNKTSKNTVVLVKDIDDKVELVIESHKDSEKVSCRLWNDEAKISFHAYAFSDPKDIAVEIKGVEAVIAALQQFVDNVKGLDIEES